MIRLAIQLVVFSVLLIITIGAFQNPYKTDFKDAIKKSAIAVSNQKDPLYLEIVKQKDKYEIPPQDARIDRVWKAIPGLNGLKVNVEESYKRMEKSGKFNPLLLVFEEVRPKVTLDDLPPSPIYRGHPDKPMVSFLVNVAWGNEYIPFMLKTMAKHHVTATFFLDGSWVKKYPDIAKMIVDAGHEIGNHAYSHPDLKNLSSHAIREQIVKTNEIIKATTGVTPKWFAPPSGSFKDEVIKIAAEENMKVILWTVDTVDWRRPDPTAMVDRVVSKISNGTMILMHPTSSTAKGLESLILKIKEKEYQIANVSTLLSEERVKIK
ncbi:polysaccharide deacetylase family protein [Calidifontibacillus erzurumensis]|uniref:Polysaccharide deacetylase family protein n=1 Tax=Calidifontibacillus erzurumensis TaxID=2741433 RepID=A0A8J8GBZ2_9BACI|nr:polysaccharide deacetylase family protein [Calidifontibacillus erzurumensis]NSL51135.1 polysaccharide deacetylase family protein [Calidifontibacillus erzurumensis]